MKKENEVELLKVYGTTDPQAIKLKIIWLHLQALMKVHFPTDQPGTIEHKAIQRYRLHWEWCDASEVEREEILVNQ